MSRKSNWPRWMAVSVAALIAFGTATGDAGDNAPCPIMARPVLLGLHRGGMDLWPENTVVAFEAAAQRWPDALLEMDVHMTADGHVVVIHDATVDRTTNGSGLVSTMTLAEIQALDGAYRFTRDNGATFPYRGKGITIPTLEEVLAVSNTHRFLIEMKDGEDVAAATVAAVRAANASDRAILAAAPPVFIEQTRAIAPDIATSYDFISASTMLDELRAGDWKNYAPQHRMLALSPTLKTRVGLMPEEIAAIREKGILVAFWTINEETEMRRLLSLGVDSIITDRPDALAAILTE